MYLTSDVLTSLDIVYKTQIKYTRNLGYIWGIILTPHMVIDLVLRISKEKTSLITDVDQHLFVERSVRGGILFTGIVSWKLTRLDNTPMLSQMQRSRNVYPITVTGYYPFKELKSTLGNSAQNGCNKECVLKGL